MDKLTRTHPSPLIQPAHEDRLEAEQARAELLESLPARLEPSALAAVMELHDQGKPSKTIGGLLTLDPLVVWIEVRRELTRREQHQREHGAADTREAGKERLALLTRREMNRLAKGSHIPNEQLRAIVDRALRCRPGLKLTAVLREAGIKDSSHGKRLLGYMPYSGSARPSETIPLEHATHLVRALGCSPVDVAGL
jgi:hypothetical protein